MPLYQSLGLSTGAEKYAVVLDIGQAYTKVGFAGEPSPRAVIPTLLKAHGKKDETIICGIFERADIDRKQLARKLKIFLHRIYSKYLQINSKDRRVIVCESLLNPTVFRETVADVLFTNFEVPSVLFAPHHLLACFTVAVNTALVLDCSEYEASALPVIEGTPIIWGWHSGPLASAAVHEQIQLMCRAEGSIQKANLKPEELTEDLPTKVIEDIKVKACFVAGYERGKKIQTYRQAQIAAAEKGETPPESSERPKPPPNMVYPMGGDCLLLLPGKIREEATETLFEQDNERLSIATLVLDAILKCPFDSRRELCKNLIVTGGTTMLPGFLHRLISELRNLVAEEDRYQQLTECEFALHKPPTPANLVSWLGAAIFASLETFPTKSITKEYFAQHNKRLPDWCVLDLKAPELQTERPSSLFTGVKGYAYSPKAGSVLGKGGARTKTTAASAALASLRLAQAEKQKTELQKGEGDKK